MTILDNGQVGINWDFSNGVVPADYKLAINGKILAEEVKMKLHDACPDYVFD